MKFLYDVNGAQLMIRSLPIYSGAAAIAKGAVIIKGTADDTSEPFAVVGSGACADTIGVLEEAVAATDTDSAIGGTALNMVKAVINPGAVYLAEYSQLVADTINPSAVSSGTTFNCTSIADGAGAWLYVISSTSNAARGQLQWVVADGTNTLTTKTAFSPVVDTDAYFLKILPQFCLTGVLSAAATGLATTAAAGTMNICVLDNFIQADNIPLQRLDPRKHSGLTGLNSQHPHFYAEIMFRDHILNPLS
jgi:hypothetical protein